MPYHHFIKRNIRLYLIVVFAATALSSCDSLKSKQTEYFKLHYTNNGKFGPRPYQTPDLYLPKNNKNSMPLLIFIQGGFWSAPDAKSLLDYVRSGSRRQKNRRHAKPDSRKDCQAALWARGRGARQIRRERIWTTECSDAGPEGVAPGDLQGRREVRLQGWRR